MARLVLVFWSKMKYTPGVAARSFLKISLTSSSSLAVPIQRTPPPGSFLKISNICRRLLPMASCQLLVTHSFCNDGHVVAVHTQSEVQYVSLAGLAVNDSVIARRFCSGQFELKKRDAVGLDTAQPPSRATMVKLVYVEERVHGPS